MTYVAMVQHPYLLVEDLLRHVPLPRHFLASLRDAYSQPYRLYHNLGHLALMWSVHIQNKMASGIAFDADAETLLACAVAYHDAVQESHNGDNAKLSAELWMRHSLAAPDDLDARWVQDAICATATPCAVRDPHTPRAQLCNWLVGLDLAAFAVEERLFGFNTQALLLEGQWMQGDACRRRLRAFGRHLLDQDAIYLEEPLHTQFEAQARRNITRMLAQQPDMVGQIRAR